MGIEAVLALIGGIALLVGIFGGGIEAEKIKIPQINCLLRIIMTLTGLGLLVLAIFLSNLEFFLAAAPVPQPPQTSMVTKPAAYSQTTAENVFTKLPADHCVATGLIARVAYTDGKPLNIRETPHIDAKIIDSMPEGTKMTISEGPMFEDGYWWWKVMTASGAIGYVAESVSGICIIEPLP
jgi:hypothetical protein